MHGRPTDRARLIEYFAGNRLAPKQRRAHRGYICGYI